MKCRLMWNGSSKVFVPVSFEFYGENAVDDSMSLTFSEEVHLTYGFLSARWQGQGSSQFTSILADEPIAPYTYTSTEKYRAVAVC